MAHLIECWFDDFTKAKKSIDDYSDTIVAGMILADMQIHSLQGGIWVGEDASKFAEEWKHVTSGNDSIQTKFKHALTSLSTYLADVERMYRNAQQKAFDSAARNCRY